MTGYNKLLDCFFPNVRSESERIDHYKIHGDCLEGIGVHIPRGGVAFVDKNADPHVGDLAVILTAEGSLQAYVKEIESIDERGIIARTRYTDPQRDIKLVAREYCGTVLKITDESGAVIWESKSAHVPLSRCRRCGEYYKSGARHSCARDPFFRAYRVPPAPMSAAVCAR